MALAVLIALVSVYGIVLVARAGPVVDCNNNAIPDNCDLSCGPAGGACDVPNCGLSADCNSNGIPDECDIAPSIMFSQAATLSMGTDGINWMATYGSTAAGAQLPIRLNNDNDTDLIVTSQTEQKLSVFLGQVGAEFGPRDTYPLSGNLPQNPAPADCNNDSFMDVIIANRGDFGPGDFLSLFRNAGDGTGLLLPEEQIALGTGFTSQYVVGADFDEDGLVDLVSLAGSHPNPGLWIQLLRNLGNCTFAPAVNCLVGASQIGTLRAVADDFNNDAWPDLAISKEPDEVVVLLNSTQGVFDCTMFGAPASYQAGDYPNYPTTSDFDGDTHVDIVVTNLGQYTNMPGTAFLWNNGDGTFSAPQIHLCDSYPGGISVADLDSDGDQDVAVRVSDYPAPPVFILENRGARTFVPAKRFAICYGNAAGLASGDFNQDGRADLAAGHLFTQIDVLLNDYGPFSEDCNANGVPDECELPLPLCQCETACQCTSTVIGSGSFQANVGGCLVTTDSALEICIEPGDLFAKASLSVAEAPITQRDVELLLTPAPGRGVAVALYDLDPDGLTFQNPVDLTITKDVSNLNRNQRERLDLYFRDDAGGPFEPLGATCCVEEVPAGSGTFIGKCTTLLTHFSTYGFIGPLDTDGDGVFDDFAGIMDNCPTVANPKQEDPDGDGIGHACDNQDIPTVSAWGLAIAALLVLVAGTLTIRRAPRVVSVAHHNPTHHA